MLTCADLPTLTGTHDLTSPGRVHIPTKLHICACWEWKRGPACGGEGQSLMLPWAPASLRAQPVGLRKGEHQVKMISCHLALE